MNLLHQILSRLKRRIRRFAASTTRPVRPIPVDTIVEGKLMVDALEIPVVRHCNLSCRGCTHLSPLSKPQRISESSLAGELQCLTRHLHAREVRLLGGEPLLHPHLLEIIKIVRQSGIANQISLVTNGLLLHRQPDALWEAVDQVVVSLYPSHSWPTELEVRCERLAREHHVKLEKRHFDRFRESYSEIGTADVALIDRIFKTCQTAHVWRCYTLENGYLYRCPQSLLIPELCGDKTVPPCEADRVRVEESADLAQRLQAFFTSTTPVSACKFCLGSAGRLFDHEDISRTEWRLPQQHRTEEMVDFEYLKLLETSVPNAPLLCTRSEAMNPHNRDIAVARQLVTNHPFE